MTQYSNLCNYAKEQLMEDAKSEEEATAKAKGACGGAKYEEVFDKSWYFDVPRNNNSHYPVGK